MHSPDDNELLENGLAFAFGSNAKPRRAHQDSPPVHSARLESARYWEERISKEIEPVGRYKFLGILGRGGQGIVLLCLDLELGREVAIKILREGLPLSLRQRLIQEAKIYSKLDHPAIVPIFDAGELLGNAPYLVMKLVRGKTFAHLLSENIKHSDKHELLLIFEATCQALAYAHDQGVIHCDLKPSNIMVGFFSEVRVLDWGLAQILDEHARKERVEGPTAVSPFDLGAGTPGYMSPEQARGHAPQTSSDVFSLGAILYEILVGEPPIKGEDALSTLSQSVLSDLDSAQQKLKSSNAPKELVHLAARCLQPDPEQRPQRARELAEELRRYFEGVKKKSQERLLAYETEDLRDQGRRNLLRVAFLSCLLLIVLGSVVALLYVQQSERAQKIVGFVESALDSAERTHAMVTDVERSDPLDFNVWNELNLQTQRVIEMTDDNLDVSVLERVEGFEQKVDDLVRRVHLNQRFVDSLRHLWAYPHRKERLKVRNEHYDKVFEQLLGEDWKTEDQEAIIEKLGGKTAARILSVVFDDWAHVRKKIDPEGDFHKLLIQLSMKIDPVPNLMPVRRMILEEKTKLEIYTSLMKIRNSFENEITTAHSWRVLGLTILHCGWLDEAEAVYLSGLKKFPNDFFLNVLQGLMWRAHRDKGTDKDPSVYLPYIQIAISKKTDDLLLLRELEEIAERENN